MHGPIVVAGAGGFIGGHLVGRLAKDSDRIVRAVDKKPLSQWYQVHDDPLVENACLDLSDFQDCRRACDTASEVYQLAADMGGIGFIEQCRIECMRNTLINVHMLEAAYRAGVERYFFASSACVYAAQHQTDPDCSGLKEADAYPAQAERGYGWEKLYAEMLCQEYAAERGMPVWIARFHNIYGPNGSWQGGREKAPAALCRKVIEAIDRGEDEIEIWGDGTRTRSFTWIDDCLDGIQQIVNCDALMGHPVNLGSDELVTVDELARIVEGVAGVELKHRYRLDAPQGVNGRCSDNSMIRRFLGWSPQTPLRVGIAQTYPWIRTQYHLQKSGKRVLV